MESSQRCLRRSPPLGARSSRTRCKEEPGSRRFWRPWMPTQKDAERRREQNHRALCDSSEIVENSAKLTQYTHPVRYILYLLAYKTHFFSGKILLENASDMPVCLTCRLFWPKSRCFDYLYHEAEALLKNFPVQATISFYEDSDSEEENDEPEHGSGEDVGC